MNRRTALAWALGAAAASAGGGLAGLLGARSHGARIRAALPAALTDLYDERFVAALPQTPLEAVAARLVARGVLVGAPPGEDKPNSIYSWPLERLRWRFDIARVAANAADDALIEFNHALYAETELLLYAFVARLTRWRGRNGGGVGAERQGTGADGIPEGDPR